VFKWQALLKAALTMHLIFVVAASCFALVTGWGAAGSAMLGLVITGVAATVQGCLLNARGFRALWWSQGIKWMLLGLGTIGALIAWPELMLPGFLVGVIASQLIWARVGMQRAKALRAGR